MRRIGGTSGLTLVELAVAILVLSIGTLAALRSLEGSSKAALQAEDRVLAQIAVRNRAEELRLYGPGAALPTEVTLAGHPLTLSQDTTVTAGGLARVTVVAQVASGAGAQLVVWVAPGALR
ncbi:MAG: type II secretion system protein [Pseudomonadota bacterium]